MFFILFPSSNSSERVDMIHQVSCFELKKCKTTDKADTEPSQGKQQVEQNKGCLDNFAF